MKNTMTIVGGLGVLIGGIWFLQGIGILPGSFMSGQPQWAVNGGIVFVLGAILLALSRRRR